MFSHANRGCAMVLFALTSWRRLWLVRRKSCMPPWLLFWRKRSAGRRVFDSSPLCSALDAACRSAPYRPPACRGRAPCGAADGPGPAPARCSCLSVRPRGDAQEEARGVGGGTDPHTLAVSPLMPRNGPQEAVGWPSLRRLTKESQRVRDMPLISQPSLRTARIGKRR